MGDQLDRLGRDLKQELQDLRQAQQDLRQAQQDLRQGQQDLRQEQQDLRQEQQDLRKGLQSLGDDLAHQFELGHTERKRIGEELRLLLHKSLGAIQGGAAIDRPPHWSPTSSNPLLHDNPSTSFPPAINNEVLEIVKGWVDDTIAGLAQ